MPGNLGLHRTIFEPRQNYISGPIHVKLVYNTFQSKMLDSYIEFRVTSPSSHKFLVEMPKMLMDSEFSWSSIREDDFEEGDLSLKLKINEVNVIDCLDFFLNTRVMV